MATHMALGFLYLGGGRLSLSTTPDAIAALVCACFPKFPIHSNDNRYHLQALRHLYVLAVQPRLLTPLEMPSMEPCYTNVQVVFNDAVNSSFNLRAPCLLPELRFLQRVQLFDPRYRTIVFDRQNNWQKLERILQGSDHLVVQRKAGCLSYIEDPAGLATLATPTLAAWAIRPSAITNFTTDKFVLFLCRHFLGASERMSGKLDIKKEAVPLDKTFRFLSIVLNDCVVNEKTDLVKSLVQLLHQSLSEDTSTLDLWQVKFLINFPATSSSFGTHFVDAEFVLALRHELESSWDEMNPLTRDHLKTYLSTREIPRERDNGRKLAQLTVFYDIPPPSLNDVEDPIARLIQSGNEKLAARLVTLLYL